MNYRNSLFLALVTLAGTSACEHLPYYGEETSAPEPQLRVFATGLTSPLGLETDARGQLWVTEAGTGQTNDGQLSLVTSGGKVFPVVRGFSSVVSPEGAVFGLNHLLLHHNTLWMLHGVEGKLYKLDISNFKPGDAPLQAQDLAYEDIGSFVKSYRFENDTDETDIFNLTLGPGGDLFIVDAAANAIIRRQAGTGRLSVFATIPAVDHPGGEPAQVQAVPTGIVFDGRQFLVCNFTGYPFPARQAPLYRVDLQGHVSVYQTGFSSSTDLALGLDRKPVVVEYGTWTGETFARHSGAIVYATPQKRVPLISGLNFPNSIQRANARTYYIAQTFDGVIQQITF